MVDEKKQTIDEKFNDYETTPVPPEVHMSWLDQGFVWVGVGFCLAAIATGGVLASGLSFSQMIVAALLGSVILTIIAVLTGLIGAHTHLSSSVSARYCFGITGSKIIGLIFAFCMFGWFAFQADLFGYTIVTLISQKLGVTYPVAIFTIIGGLAMMITAIIGFRGIKFLSQIAVPLLFILSAVALIKTFTIVPWSQISTSGPTGTPISLPIGIAAVVGNFAVGVTLCADFSRYSRRPKDAVIGSILGYFIGYVPILLLGAIFTYAFKNWNVVEVMIGTLGFGSIGAFVLIAAQWTTNDNNLYQAVLGLVNAIKDRYQISRLKLTLFVGIVSTIIAGVGLYKYYFNFLILMTSTIPPIAGTLIADFFILNKKVYKYENMDKLSKFNYAAVGSWILGVLVAFAMSAPPTGFGIWVKAADVMPIPLAGMLTSMISHIVLTKVLKTSALKEK